MTTALEIDGLIDGKYRIERFIGEGGMGVVALATHVALEQRVALKLLRPDQASSEIAVQRFVREARAAARIKSEHVARVYDVGTVDGHPYIVMEYLEGADLDAILLDAGRLSVDTAVGYLLEACEAMAEAHAAGMMHRDLKPSNLFLAQKSDGTEVLKVLDFGIAKSMHPEAVGRVGKDTREGAGTPAYMAPEQLRASSGVAVDTRADIWALGVVLFELLCGRPPFVTESTAELAVDILTKDPPHLRDLVAGIPPVLDDVVMRCLAKNPDERFATITELALALQPVAAPRAVASIERIVRQAARLRTPTTTDAPLPSRTLRGRDVRSVQSRRRALSITTAPRFEAESLAALTTGPLDALMPETAQVNAKAKAPRSAIVAAAITVCALAAMIALRPSSKPAPREETRSAGASANAVVAPSSAAALPVAPVAPVTPVVTSAASAPPAVSSAPASAPSPAAFEQKNKSASAGAAIVRPAKPVAARPVTPANFGSRE